MYFIPSETNGNYHELPCTQQEAQLPEIAHVSGHYASQGHSRSLILIPVKSLYSMWLHITE